MGTQELGIASVKIPKSDKALLEAYRKNAALIERIRAANPAITFKPNAVQKRILAMLDEGIRNGCRSFGILPGNGVGKTTLLANLIYNIAAGPMNEAFELDFIRKWPFHSRELRLVCDRSDILEQSGGMWQAIHQWWPAGGFKVRQQGYDHESMYELPNGFTLSVRRPDQPPKVHESNTLAAMFMNEPPNTAQVWQQYGARLRGSGFRSLWGTVWNSDMAWVGEEIVDNALARHLFADLHECCKEHSPDGHMSHDEIMAVIADYPEDQREARQTGRFGGLSSRVFRIIPEAHYFHDDPPDDLQCYASLDPHPHKPWVYLVGGLDTAGDWWILDEWPHENYQKLKSDLRGLADYATLIREYDARHSVRDRVIDRRGSAQNIRRDYGSTTVRSDLETQYRLRFRDGNPHVQDDGNEIGGVTAIKNLLRHDDELGIVTKLHIGPKCQNLRRSLEKLSKKKDKETGRPTEKIDDEFLDFPRALMYLVMAGFRYKHSMSKTEVLSRKRTAREKELHRALRERPVEPASATATAIDWFN